MPSASLIEEYDALYKLASTDLAFELEKEAAGALRQGAGRILKRFGSKARGAGEALEESGKAAPRRFSEVLKADEAIPAHIRPGTDESLSQFHRQMAGVGDEAGTVAMPAGRAGPGKTKAVDAGGPAPGASKKVDAAGAAPSDVAPDATGGLAPWKRNLGLGVGAAGVGAGGYALGEQSGVDEANRNRNLAFGAGLATGTVAPQLVRRAGGILQGMTGGPQGGPPPGAYREQVLRDPGVGPLAYNY